jgi:glutamate carboxypeptidase
MAAGERVEAALTWLREQRPAMEHLLSELVAENSHTENVDGVARVAARLAAALGELGELDITVGRHLSHDTYGPHLCATTRAPGPRTFLIGHLDTVFRPGTFEGWRAEGGRAFGPGVLDMKGGLVVMAYVLLGLGRAGLLGQLPLALVAVAEEEVGSPESQPLLAELVAAQGAARGLVFESGRAGDLVVTRRKGTGAATVTARGRAAHAGNAHGEGKNAIWALARFVDAAQRLTDYPREITVNVGRIEGGQGKNTVPDLAHAWVDFRFVHGGDGTALLDALERAAAQATTEVPGTRIEVRGRIARPALERSEASGELLREYARCAQAAGLGCGEAPLAGGGSDANTLAALGVPVIDALGPRGTGYHTTEEQIELATLVPKAEAVLRLLAESA